MSARAASTECAEKPRKRTLPAFRAATNVSRAPPGAKIFSTSSFVVDGVQLVQVEMIRPHLAQRAVQLALRPLAAALRRLARQENALAIGFERRPEHLLGVAVARRHVEVVDAVIDRLGDAVRRLLRGGVHDDDAAEAEDGEPLARAAERPAFQLAGFGDALEARERRGEAREHRRGRTLQEEIAAFHGHLHRTGFRTCARRLDRAGRSGSRAASGQSIAPVGYHPPHECCPRLARKSCGRRSRRRPAAPRVARCLPRLRDVPDDGRGAAPRRRRVPRAGERVLGVPGLSSDPRALGGLLAARPHSAVVLVHGRRGRAVLDGQPPREGPVEGRG